jgi:hypothetical protein
VVLVVVVVVDMVSAGVPRLSGQSDADGRSPWSVSHLAVPLGFGSPRVKPSNFEQNHLFVGELFLVLPIVGTGPYR